MGLWADYTKLKVPLEGDSIQIATPEYYNKSVTGTRPMTRKEALELVELFKISRDAVTDAKVKWFISTEIQKIRKAIIGGQYD